MDNLLTRKATPKEAEDISDIIKTAMKIYAADSNIPGTLTSLTEDVSDIKKYIENDELLVAVFHDKLAGTVRISKLKDNYYQISRFSVLPAMQKLGVGSILFFAAEDYLRSVKAEKCLLYTALTNISMVRFYASRGFELVETKYERGYPRGRFEKKYHRKKERGKGNEKK